MFVQVTVVLTRAKFAILFLDEEERGGLRGIGWTDFPCSEVLVEEILGSLLFIGGKGVDFPNFGREGVVKVDFMVVESRGR